ncbi:hypothetical protein G9A89_012462 [Geosiphon pyriformis]|nr:hypothetical protein G9A89_012462 [Geosiphon pyriformis]
MFTKKSARGATASSVNRSLKQKPKVLLDKVKHSGNETNLFYKLPASVSGRYENIDTSSNKKLEYEMGKNMGYGSKSDGQLDSCTNTPKAKCFNSDMIVAPFLDLCDFGSVTDDINMGLPLSVSLGFFYCSVASVKEKLCFEPIKSFVLDIGLSAIPRNSLCNKLKSIIWASFTSNSSLALTKQLAVFENLVINADLKKFGIYLSKLAIESALITGLVVSKWSILLDLRNSYCALLYTLLMGMTAHNLLDLIQSYGGKTCYISRNLESYTQTHCAVVCFDSDNTREAAICFTLVFRSVNLVWAGLFFPKCAVCGNFGHVLFGCKSGEKNSGQDSIKKKFLCSDLNKRRLVLIYAKKQAPVSYLVFFSGVTWASVVSSFPKNLYSTSLAETNSGIGSVASLMSVVTFLALCVSVLKHSLKNVSDQVANILCKLNRLLAVLLVNSTVSSTPKHNPMLNMTVNALLFVSPISGVVTAISQNISPSGAHVLTAKIGGLEANLVVLENSVKAILCKLDFFCSGSGMFPGVKVFTSGLDAGFLGAGVILIINKNLAKHVSKIFEILGRLLMVCLLFKNKQSVSVLGLYTKASLNKHVIQTGLINFFIARACNKSMFVILGGDFNKDRNKHSSSFNKYVGLDVKRILDYIFVFQSLSNALVNGCIVDVDKFFNTDYSSVQITIGLGGILDPVLRAICIQTNKNKWKFNYRIAFHDNFAMFSDEFTDCHCLSDLDGMWSVVCKAICFSVNEVFSKTWSKDFDGGFTKCSSCYYRLELLVSKLVKALCSVSFIGFVSLLNVWMSLNSVNASAVKSFFLSGSHFNAIRLALVKIRKFYHFLKMIESKLARNSQIRLAIDKRMENFELNKGQTIKSILEQPFCKVTLDHLVVDEDLILESGLVKFHVDRIMEGWTRKRVMVDDISDEWRCQLQLLEYIFDDVFSNVMHPIEMEEFFGMVLNLPDNKAAGLSTLIETAHKIISKILSDRISMTCNKHDVLCGNNFSVLKDTTIQSPIFAIDSVIKDALEKNRELWLVLRSLVRIKMCSRFIRFFGSIHNDCINKVMTDFGLTNGYSVHNSLDQEEVFLLLLWHIFYDTLLCGVKRQEAMCGYRLNSHYVVKTGRINLQDSLTFFFAIGIFVNNTIWVGSSQTATQHILNVASKFFRVNDISINNDKTVTIPINCRVVASFLSVSSAPISIAKKGVSHQYLGIFFSSNGLSKPSLAKAHLDVWFFANLVLRKTVSDKQFSYLVLAVLHSIIGYKTQFSFVSANVCQKWDVQAKGKVAAMVCFTNSGGILGQLFKHSFPVCISVNPLNNFLASVIQVFFGSSLSLGNFMCNVFHFQYRTLLSGVLSESMYFRCLPSLCCYEIAFFAAAVWYLYDFGSFDVCSLPPDDNAAKNILESHKFKTVCDWLSGVGVSGFSVYMDGSLCGLGSVNIKAGATAFFKDFNLGIGVKVTGIVFSILAELQAIALALKCVPSLSSVHIFSDSQAALDACKAKLLLKLNVGWYKIKEHSNVLGNVQADLFAEVSFCLGQLLPFRLKECFVLAKGSIVSGNSKHFVHDVFQSIYCACWELGSAAKIVNNHLLVNVDWSKLSLV